MGTYALCMALHASNVVVHLDGCTSIGGRVVHAPRGPLCASGPSRHLCLPVYVAALHNPMHLGHTGRLGGHSELARNDDPPPGPTGPSTTTTDHHHLPW